MFDETRSTWIATAGTSTAFQFRTIYFRWLGYGFSIVEASRRVRAIV